MSAAHVKRRLSAKGHRLTIEWSGEYSINSSSTGICLCGWSESASNQHEVRHEYRVHLSHVTGYRWNDVGNYWEKRA